MAFREAQLDNGLTVVAEVNASAASAAMGFFVRTGSRDETPDVLGVSHFLEHMMFKGNDHYTALDLNRAFDDLGAEYNAATSHEKTVYYGAVLPEHQHPMLALLCELMTPSFRQEDFDVEKQVILDEIAVYEDQPAWKTYKHLMEAYFHGHPLGNDVLGTIESITAMTRDAMGAYHRKHYAPAGITVVGAGRVDFDAMVAQIGETCGHWAGGTETHPVPPSPDHQSTEILTDANIQRQHLGLMSPAPSEQDAERHAAELASTILGDVTNSRLYYALIDPALADEAHVIYEGLDGVGAMFTYTSCDPDRAGEVLQIVRNQFACFQADGPTEAELTAAKNKLASGATLAAESSMRRLMGVGNDLFYRHHYTSLEQDVQDLMAVTGEQAHKVTRQWDLSAATLVALGPLESL